MECPVSPPVARSTKKDMGRAALKHPIGNGKPVYFFLHAHIIWGYPCQSNRHLTLLLLQKLTCMLIKRAIDLHVSCYYGMRWQPNLETTFSVAVLLFNSFSLLALIKCIGVNNSLSDWCCFIIMWICWETTSYHHITDSLITFVAGLSSMDRWNLNPVWFKLHRSLGCYFFNDVMV